MELSEAQELASRLLGCTTFAEVYQSEESFAFVEDLGGDPDAPVEETLLVSPDVALISPTSREVTTYPAAIPLLLTMRRIA